MGWPIPGTPAYVCTLQKGKKTLANQVVRGNGCDPLWGSRRTEPCPLLVQDPSGVWYPYHWGTYPYPNTPVTEVSTLIPSHWGSVPQYPSQWGLPKYPSHWGQYPNTPFTGVTLSTPIPQSLGSVPQYSIMSTTISWVVYNIDYTSQHMQNSIYQNSSPWVASS